MNLEVIAILILAAAIIAWFIPASRVYVLAASVGGAITWFLTGRKPAGNVDLLKEDFAEKLERESAEHQTTQRRIDDAASPDPDLDPVPSRDVERLRAGLAKHRRDVADRDVDDLGISDRD